MLVRNPDADALHRNGLADALAGNYAEAHENFGQAEELVTSGYLNEGTPITLDGVVQAANIARDEGFTYVREAVASRADSSRAADLFDRAREAILLSIKMTLPVMGVSQLPIESTDGHGTPKLGRREALAAHGATVGVLGRLVTAEQVVSGLDTRGDSPQAISARKNDQQQYGLAHDILRIGNNGYYRVSNAMNGARQEILNGRRVHAGVWLGRAFYGLGWTLVRDVRNFKGALLTAGSRIRDVRSYEAARESVFVRP